MEVPTLETERTTMRAWRNEDLDVLAGWLADPEVVRFVGGLASRADAWRQLALYTGHWVLRGYGLWAVQRRSDGRLIGRIGLWRPEGWPGAEVGWTLGRDAWGAGYATECGAAARDWGFARFPELERLFSLIDPANHASQRVAERIGSIRIGTWRIPGQTADVDLWAIERGAEVPEGPARSTERP